MKTVYITLTGTKHYFGSEFLEKDMEVILKKEPDNEHDHEAIMVKLAGLGKIGYVANSHYTVTEDSMSAGRLYDKIGDTATAKVLYKIGDRAILTVEIEDSGDIYDYRRF